MRIFQCGFSLKPTICSLLSQSGYIKGNGVIFRRYNPFVDEIVNKFTFEEWSMIYDGIDEQRLRKWNEIALDRILLISEDTKDNIAFGFICLEELKDRLGTVLIHGGIWNHSIRHMIQVFKGQNYVLSVLLRNGFTIETTCLISNKKADRMQKKLGFVEYKKDGELSYKILETNKFFNNIFQRRMENFKIIK